MVAIQPAMAQSDANAEAAFFNSSYTYCDAKMVGALWGQDAAQGKIEIGHKIINGWIPNLESWLERSRASGNRCNWEDTGLSYSDAEALAGFWDISTAGAKAKAAHILTNGGQNVLDSILR